jgi:hypothetical protein
MVVSGALKNIPAKYQDKVVAVVLYGAGDGSKVNQAFFNKALANCAPGDFVSLVAVVCRSKFNDIRPARTQGKGRDTFRTTTRERSGTTARLSISKRRSAANLRVT